MYLPDGLYDLVMENIAGVEGMETRSRVPIEAAGAMTSAQAAGRLSSAMRPRALGLSEGCVIDRQRLEKLQADDADLKTPPKRRRGRRNDQAEVKVKRKDGIWYSVFSHPLVQCRLRESQVAGLSPETFT